MAARTAIVVNPTAGHGRAGRLWPALREALAAGGLAFDASLTGGPGDATRLAAAARRAGCELVVSVGGDGTLNEVVDGLLADGAAPTADGLPALGIVPAGSGCDLARTLGLGRGLAAVPALLGGRTRPVDVGQVAFRTPSGQTACRHFINAADLGIGADVAARVNRSSKLLGGFLSFLAGAAAAIIAARFQPVEYALDDAPPVAARAAMLFVANGRYAAGGMYFAPAAELDDGLLDVVVLGEVSRLELLLSLLPRVYRGAHLGHPAVLYRQAARLTVRSSEAVPLEVDGEPIGETPATFRALPRALRVAVPAPARPARRPG